MGVTMAKALIGSSEEVLKEIEFLVDTGRFYTILPPSEFDELGIEVRHRERVVTADHRTLTIDIGSAHIEVGDRAAAMLVGRMNVPDPLLGVSALEATGLKVNHVDETLEPARPYPGIPML